MKRWKLKKFLESYGQEKGYTATSFYGEVLKRLRDFSDKELEQIGVYRGSSWTGELDRVKEWLDSWVKPGPSSEVRDLRHDLTWEEFLETDGKFRLAQVVGAFEAQIGMSYEALRSRWRRSLNAEKELGISMSKANILIVDPKGFGRFLNGNGTV